jgi:solute carrier family 25 oxoglutarate transporter 11
MADNPVWKATKPFFTGSLSGCIATCCIQPMDMVKVRIQVAAAEGGSTNPVSIARKLVADEGFMALYSGLSAGLTRQVVYTGARLGLYDVFCDMAKTPGEKSMPLTKTAGCAIAAGGLAAIMGNPADLSLIRMQTNAMLPVEKQVVYRHAGHAMSMILKEEGAMGLFKGAVPTSVRAMGLNLGMLGGNSVAKDALSSNFGLAKSGAACVFGASAIAGFFASAFSLPFDFVKTQIQKQKPDAQGNLPYKNGLDCAMKMMAEGGPLRFYAGFPTYYLRIAPHAMITLIAQDQVKKLWGSMGL